MSRGLMGCLKSAKWKSSTNPIIGRSCLPHLTGWFSHTGSLRFCLNDSLIRKVYWSFSFSSLKSLPPNNFTPNVSAKSWSVNKPGVSCGASYPTNPKGLLGTSCPRISEMAQAATTCEFFFNSSLNSFRLSLITVPWMGIITISSFSKPKFFSVRKWCCW